MMSYLPSKGDLVLIKDLAYWDMFKYRPRYQDETEPYLGSLVGTIQEVFEVGGDRFWLVDSYTSERLFIAFPIDRKYYEPIFTK